MMMVAPSAYRGQAIEGVQARRRIHVQGSINMRGRKGSMLKAGADSGARGRSARGRVPHVVEHADFRNANVPATSPCIGLAGLNRGEPGCWPRRPTRRAWGPVRGRPRTRLAQAPEIPYVRASTSVRHSFRALCSKLV